MHRLDGPVDIEVHEDVVVVLPVLDLVACPRHTARHHVFRVLCAGLQPLLEGARGLVKVRPANPTAGSDPAAIVTRIRGALAAGDLKTALAEWETLPEEARSATSEWAEAAGARMAADDLVARLRSDALAKLETEG